jgi:hypothetical protein
MMENDADFPSDADFTEAYNLTSWIDNTTLREEIRHYLLLCPEQDMCIGEQFRRSYKFTLHPSCSQCECDDSCVRRSTCCPSKFLRQTPAPDFVQYPSTSDDKHGPLLHCLEPLWNMGSQIKARQSYWMTKICPDSADCISPPSRNITNFTPVTSSVTRETYINVNCAVCNNERLSDLVSWEKKKICNTRYHLLSKQDPDTFYDMVFQQFSHCNLGFYPPASVQNMVNPCLTPTIEVNCEVNRDMNYLSEACRKYHLPYNTNNEVYKNIYCSLCEFDAKDLRIQYDKYSNKLSLNQALVPFSALMDFKKAEEKPIAKKTKCATDQIFDEKLVSYFISPLCIFFYQKPNYQETRGPWATSLTLVTLANTEGFLFIYAFYFLL